MAVILDQTVQHSGWAGADFAHGGWDDFFPIASTTPAAVSFWASVLNGQATDIAAAFNDSGNTTGFPLWFNVHSAGSVQGLTNPSPFHFPGNVGIHIFTRVPAQNNQILFRLVVTSDATTPPPTDPPCKYGTTPKDPNLGGVLVTSEVIASVLGFVGFPELAFALVPVIGTLTAVKDLCSGSPPPMPLLNADGAFASLSDALQAWRAVSWPFYCQCVPGVPAPIPFPPPQVVVPPGGPTFPTFPCDPADLCSSVSAIRQQVFALATQLTETRELVVLLQRYGLPFAAIPGAFHLALTGEGGFPISRLLGFQVDIAARPLDVRVLEGNPPYLWDMGWMAISDSNGMVQEKRITRDTFTWTPDGCQFATAFTYFLFPGVSVNVRELQAEP